MENEVFSWEESIRETYQEFANQLISYAPELLGAIALLAVGWLVAHALKIGTKKLIKSFDSLFARAAKTAGVTQGRIKRSYSGIISNIVFWSAMIFFIAAATNLLGWNMFSNWMNSIIIYLPNFITGLLIILAGFILSNIVRTGIFNAANSAGIAQSDILSRIVQLIILFTGLVIGIEQIGINVDFLTNVLIVVIGVLLAGAALAFGIGASKLVSNVIGVQYFRKYCRVGETLQIDGNSGKIIEVTQTYIILETASGRTVIPASYFQEKISHLSSVKVSTSGGTKISTE